MADSMGFLFTFTVVFFFNFSYKKNISTELISLYVLLWLFQWYISQTIHLAKKICQVALNSEQCKGTYWTIFFSVHSLFSARVIWHIPSVISIKTTKPNKNKTHSSLLYKKNLQLASLRGTTPTHSHSMFISIY